MNIQQDLLTKNKYSRPGVLLKAVKGIVIHWVANPGTSAQANRNYFENLKAQPPGLPPEKYRYASAHYVIGIELCHPVADGKFTGETLESCRELVASLLAAYGLSKDDVWRHYDITEKVCPKYFVEHTNEWDAFKASL